MITASDLQQSKAEVEHQTGRTKYCARCKRWHMADENHTMYVSGPTQDQSAISHGICWPCRRIHFPQFTQ